MASEQPAAAEVAEDFKASLEWLTNNDRYAINNFTVIARENTEFANEICNVLIEHIGKVSIYKLINSIDLILI
jgi:pre-mRNA cleavage complex 2 protein Pcf11